VNITVVCSRLSMIMVSYLPVGFANIVLWATKYRTISYKMSNNMVMFLITGLNHVDVF
jgi:hypothetical protein